METTFANVVNYAIYPVCALMCSVALWVIANSLEDISKNLKNKP